MDSSDGATHADTTQWHGGQVDKLLEEHETGTEQEAWRSGISKQHWINVDDRVKCANRKCLKKFTITQRKHHCRKCGEVFCKACLRHQRKLSERADYDPNGRKYQVCEVCFNSEPQKIGQTHSWKKHFMDFRQEHYSQKLSSTEIQNGIRKSFQVKHEVNRLIAGYKEKLERDTVDGKTKLSNFKGKVQGLVNKPEIPSWHKAGNWMVKDLRQKCMICEKVFNRHLSNQKHNCRVCGIVICNDCSSRDFLLFVADKHERDKYGDDPRWAIIKVAGCPTVEPDIHCYLRMCNLCKTMLETLQLGEAQKAVEEGQMVESMTELINIHEGIDTVQSKIEEQLPKYKQLVDGLEITSASPRSLPTNRSNMQTLAKAQGDLMDHFTKFVMCVSHLKKFKPSSNTQVKLGQNIMKCKFDYYHENMHRFRKLKKQLEDVAPPETLMGIQEIVDSKTIEVACLSITQVAYETLYLCMKYSIDEVFASNIIHTSEVCKVELRDYMQKKGEDWEKFCQQMELFIKLQMKGDGGKRRQYLRPSGRLAGAYGAPYISSFLTERVAYLAQQIYLQLTSRSVDRKFKQSKMALSELCHKIRDGKTK